MSDSGKDNSDSDEVKRQRREQFVPEHSDDSGVKSIPTKVDALHKMVHHMNDTLDAAKGIRHHSGNKYLRKIKPADNEGLPIWVDVYCIIKAFGVTGAGQQHALKKILCAGIRGKGDQSQDLQEAVDALYRAIEQEKEDQL